MCKSIHPQQYILLGIPVLFLIGALFHFIYALSGFSPLVGLIAPVNESIFEHIKMSTLPLFLWWSIYFMYHKNQIDPNLWFTAALFSMLTVIFTIPMLYYFYTGALGVHSSVIDILILLVALSLGQLLARHIYRYGKGMDYHISVLLMLGIITIFAFFTISPPSLPLFRDTTNGSYGM